MALKNISIIRPTELTWDADQKKHATEIVKITFGDRADIPKEFSKTGRAESPPMFHKDKQGYHWMVGQLNDTSHIIFHVHSSGEGRHNPTESVTFSKSRYLNDANSPVFTTQDFKDISDFLKTHNFTDAELVTAEGMERQRNVTAYMGTEVSLESRQRLGDSAAYGAKEYTIPAERLLRKAEQSEVATQRQVAAESAGRAAERDVQRAEHAATERAKRIAATHGIGANSARR